MFGHSNYVCPEKMRVVASQMTEIQSIMSLFITCDQVIGLPNHVIRSPDTPLTTPLNIMGVVKAAQLRCRVTVSLNHPINQANKIN